MKFFKSKLELFLGLSFEVIVFVILFRFEGGELGFFKIVKRNLKRKEKRR